MVRNRAEGVSREALPGNDEDGTGLQIWSTERVGSCAVCAPKLYGERRVSVNNLDLVQSDSVARCESVDDAAWFKVKRFVDTD